MSPPRLFTPQQLCASFAYQRPDTDRDKSSPPDRGDGSVTAASRQHTSRKYSQQGRKNGSVALLSNSKPSQLYLTNAENTLLYGDRVGIGLRTKSTWKGSNKRGVLI